METTTGTASIRDSEFILALAPIQNLLPVNTELTKKYRGPEALIVLSEK
jgi:hypothetical protein